MYDCLRIFILISFHMKEKISMERWGVVLWGCTWCRVVAVFHRRVAQVESNLVVADSVSSQDLRQSVARLAPLA